ncbi:PKD domain-containing protein [Agromyces neolithicus]
MTVEECSTTRHPECDLAAPPAAPTTPAPGTPAVTLRDIASFRPAEPSDVMEPNGWAIEGLPANFVADASTEVVSGTLLGQPADVRFTPVGYRWVHSDGANVASSSPGATWSALGVAEFTPTDTSHVYAASGEYTVTLRVSLAAEYRFAGSGWLPIAGTLTIDAAPQRVLVGEVDTVLTVGDCTEYPSSPGC